MHTFLKEVQLGWEPLLILSHEKKLDNIKALVK